MPDDGDRPALGDVAAAADAFENLPMTVVVTDGPELRTVAFNAAARAVTEGRLVHGTPILEALPQGLSGQGWPEAYSTPTRTGQTVTKTEHRIQLHQPSGAVVEMYVDAVFTPRLGADGRPRGTIMVVDDVTQRVLDRAESTRELAELRERYAIARGQVRGLQRVLIADSVPVLPSFEVAARYVLASDEQAAGGDWFDAVACPDGSLVLVVGDVVGHGPAAAVAMGQLRSVLLAQLRAGSGVVEAMRFLDGFAATVPAARRATVCIVRLDDSGAVEYCTAGHPPPLLLAAEEANTGYLEPSGAGPLATGTDFVTATAHLDVDESIVLYSDGILERPGTTPSAAALQLRVAAGDARRNSIMPVGAPASAAERICGLTIELLTRASGHTDDITILAADRRPPVADLDVELDVTPDALPRVRAALRTWMHDLGAGPETLEVVLHAATELVANVIDHAYLGGPPQPFTVRARLGHDSTIELDVVDRGTWKLPIVTSQRGRGLALVRALVDELSIERWAHGTTATIRREVTRHAGLMEPSAAHVRPSPRGGPGPAAGAEHFDVWSQGGPEPEVAIVGPLDAANTGAAAAHLELALTEADAVVVVDLAGVTLLPSSGVDLLFRIVDEAKGLGLELRLRAPNGSPAQHVLSLVRLPHEVVPTSSDEDVHSRPTSP